MSLYKNVWAQKQKERISYSPGNHHPISLVNLQRLDVSEITLSYNDEIITVIFAKKQIACIISEKMRFDFLAGTITYKSGIVTTLDTRKGSVTDVYLKFIDTRLTLGFYDVR